ncbi:unnamed protein product [Bursaphelenchus okinawaensis]|uniref:Uncharacterized protein n=1 Tax=Bursaphelenchus okinawaensis TaxID=465554 RepID=A0A811KZB4_9BILA|nr:unnamed protein product [Bursaphelenchus okinawaensis]CAG9113379.1 unnamed protein product [Bursaphelenchus okinawaensis]
MSDRGLDFIQEEIVKLTGKDYFITQTDSAKRRAALSKIEQYCFKFWDGLNYTRNNNNVFCKGLVKSLVESLQRKVTFATAHKWFGGLSTFTSAQCSRWTLETALPYWSSLLTLCGAGVVSNDILHKVLTTLIDDFGTAEGFVEVLMESDERLLNVLLALLVCFRQGEYDNDEFWNPLTLLLTTLIKLDFPENIFIEWLSSETCAILCIYRYLKECQNVEAVQRTLRSLSSVSFTVEEREYQEKAIETSVNTSVVITELHGDCAVEKKMMFDKKYKVTVLKKQVNYSYGGLVDSFNGFINRLRGNLERINRHNTLSMNIGGLLKVLNDVHDIDL